MTPERVAELRALVAHGISLNECELALAVEPALNALEQAWLERDELRAQVTAMCETMIADRIAARGEKT